MAFLGDVNASADYADTSANTNTDTNPNIIHHPPPLLLSPLPLPVTFVGDARRKVMKDVLKGNSSSEGDASTVEASGIGLSLAQQGQGQVSYLPLTLSSNATLRTNPKQ